MPKSLVSKSILATSLLTAMFFSTGSALASCANTEWTNVTPGHPIPTITARLCGEDLTVKVIGAAPDGSTFDFGWSVASQLTPDSYTSSFVDANATNDFLMEIDRAANTMRLTIETELTGQSDVTQWFADYTLEREYD